MVKKLVPILCALALVFSVRAVTPPGGGGAEDYTETIYISNSIMYGLGGASSVAGYLEKRDMLLYLLR